MKCGICARDAGATVVEVQLTDEEKRMVKGMTQKDAPASFFYCRPCWRVLGNAEQGASLMRGSFQMDIRAAGLPGATKLGQKLYTFLINSATKPKS